MLEQENITSYSTFWVGCPNQMFAIGNRGSVIDLVTYNGSYTSLVQAAAIGARKTGIICIWLFKAENGLDISIPRGKCLHDM